MRCVFFVLLVLGYVCGRRRDATHGNQQEDFEFVEEVDDKSRSNIDNKDGLVWILDPKNELCSLLRCGEEGICLLQDKFTAVCVNKEEASKFGDRIVPAKKWTAFKDDIDQIDDDDEDYDDDDDDEYYYDDDNDDDSDDDDEDVGYKNIEYSNGDKKSLPKLNRKPFAKKECPTCPVVRPVFLCGNDNRTYSSLCRLHYHNCLHEADVKIACKGFCPCKDQVAFKKERQRKRQNKYASKLRDTLNDEEENEDHKTKQRDFGRNLVGKSRNAAAYGRNKGHKRNSKKSMDKMSSKKAGNRNSKYMDKYWSKKKNWSKSPKNDVLYKATNAVWGTNECSPDALEEMGNRMLDWFSVIMTDSRRRPLNPQPGPSWCKKEVSWMLSHLDQNNDEKLSQKELYRLEHDDHERCIKPFIDRCDLDRDQILSSREWCKCFDQSDRPCAALRKTTQDLLGGYIPECDREGYYRPTQCHSRASMCWCVDKHGTEIAGSRKTRGSLNCEKIMKNQRFASNEIDEDAENDVDDSDAFEASGDASLDF